MADNAASTADAGKAPEGDGKATESKRTDDAGNGDDDLDGPFDAGRAKDKIRRANQEAASLRARLKELEPLAEEARKRAESEKTETQRLTEAHAAETKRADAAEDEARRLRVALRKGLTEVQAKRLVGDTEEALEADADDLLESFRGSSSSAGSTKTPAPARPTERLRTGSGSDDDDADFDASKVAAAVRGSRF